MTLSIDNASNIVTCNIETSLPATLNVLINNKTEVKNLSINSTNFSYDSYLSQGEHFLVCEVTSKLPNGVMLTNSDSKLYTIHSSFTTMTSSKDMHTYVHALMHTTHNFVLFALKLI